MSGKDGEWLFRKSTKWMFGVPALNKQKRTDVKLLVPGDCWERGAGTSEDGRLVHPRLRCCYPLLYFHFYHLNLLLSLDAKGEKL